VFGAADRTAAAVLGVHDAGGTAAGVQTALSTADTAAVCGCPLLQEVVAGPASAGGVQPLLVSLPELAA
jgi:hypothetical protein